MAATRHTAWKMRFVISNASDLVAHALDRFDAVARLAQLFAEVADMDVHGAALAVEAVAPDLPQQHVPGQHHPGGPEQHAQELELLQSQMDLLVSGPDDMPRRADVERPHPILLLGGLLGAAEHRLDPGDQLHHAEGLGQIVVGAGDRKSTRLNSSHVSISYAVFCLK